jgi:hypothetical protein
MPKIFWRKVSAGVYESDSGRFRVELEGSIWIMFDLSLYGANLPYGYKRTLRAAKMAIDEVLDEEATDYQEATP